MSDTVIASDGTLLALDNLPLGITYNTDGTIATLTTVCDGNSGPGVTYTQTFTYTSGVLTHVSNWRAP